MEGESAGGRETEPGRKDWRDIKRGEEEEVEGGIERVCVCEKEKEGRKKEGERKRESVNSL